MDTMDSLDKVFEGEVDELGTITIRVVVLPRQSVEDTDLPSTPDDPGAPSEDETDDSEQKRPIDSYLESSKRGKWVVVFLVNGQRQHQLDTMLVQKDLGLKYLRNRMMVMIDVDGLTQQALARLMSGARQSFYQGKVYSALLQRLIHTLKGDPDLLRLEDAAAQAVASLKTGDQAVKAALDKLIHEHASQGNKREGEGAAGAATRGGLSGPLRQRMDVIVEGASGMLAEGPTLRLACESSAVRLLPDEEALLEYALHPASETRITAFQLEVTPSIPDLVIRHEERPHGRVAVLLYPSPTDDSEPSYPIRATLTATALVEGKPEPRVLATRLTIAPASSQQPKAPPPPPALLETPTFMRLVTRQPITLVAGGPATHVKFQWDGHDELLRGARAPWTPRLYPVGGTNDNVPFATFSWPKNGRFELVLPVPQDAKPGATHSWRVELVGPESRTLTVSFSTVIVEAPAPRQIVAEVTGGREDHENYIIKYLQRENWSSAQCFEHECWTANDSGAFEEPKGERPLTLYINMDYKPLEDFVQDQTRRQMSEQTVANRKNRYTTHLGYHLYQMYLATRGHAAPSPSEEEGPPALSEEGMRHEISRVATTLLQLMERA